MTSKYDFSDLIDIDSLDTTSLISGIYIIVNLINDKIYVGQSVNVRNRWLNHCESYANIQIIDKAIKKYKKENFKCYLLENVNDKQLLNEREYYWANTYAECYIPNGYNIAQCGAQNRNFSKCQEISCYNDSGEHIETFISITDAIMKYHCNYILNCCKEPLLNHKAAGMYWRLGHDNHIDISCLEKIKTGPDGGRTVYKYDILSGNYLAEYKSQNEAARNVRYLRDGTNIGACCLGKLNYTCGYFWSFIKVDNIFTIKPELYLIAENKLKSYISQYDLQGNYLATYSSSVEAGKKTGLNVGDIGNCAAGRAKKHGNYIWKYTYR